MTLDEYLQVNKLTQKKFAAIIGVKNLAISRYKAGTRTPTPEIMRKIYEVTGGLVTPTDLLGLEKSSAKAG